MYDKFINLKKIKYARDPFKKKLKLEESIRHS